MRGMRKAALLAVLGGIGIAAPAAQAQEVVAPTGYLEICKRSATTDPVRGEFRFTIDGVTPVVVNTGGCSAPIQVAAGNHTVVEQNTDWTRVTATRTIPQERLVSSNLASRTDVVNVTAGDISNTTTVEYTNQAVFGTLEVCKSAQAGSGATGNASFHITGPLGFDRTITVPVGACSQSFDVPAGDQVEVDEVGPGSVNLVAVNTVRSGDLVASNLASGTTRVRVRAGGVENETIETFVNGTSRLKICKVAGSEALRGTVYSFTANGTTVTAVAQAAPGGCVLVDRVFAGGTRVDIQEGIVPGTAVTGIDVSGNRAVPGTTSLNNRSVSVVLGSGETVVTYTNQEAAPGLLKVCKNAGSGVTLGRVFNFQVNGNSLNVPAGYCAIAGSFAFNSVATVTESGIVGLSVIAGAAFPTAQLIDVDLPGRVIRARIGAGVTEVAFTNATTGTTSTDSVGSSHSDTQDAPTSIPDNDSSLGGSKGTVVIERIRARRGCRITAQLVKINNKLTLVLRARGNRRVCNVVIRQLGLQGAVVARSSKHMRAGRSYRVTLSQKAKLVRVKLV